MTPEEIVNDEMVQREVRIGALTAVREFPGLSAYLDDIAQEIWLAVLRRLPKYERDRGASLKTFCSLVVKNARFSAVKKYSMQAGAIHPDKGLDGLRAMLESGDIQSEGFVLPPDPGLKAERINIELAMDIESLLERLSPKAAEICLGLMKGMSIKEICAQAEISRSALSQYRLVEIRQACEQINLQDYLSNPQNF